MKPRRFTDALTVLLLLTAGILLFSLGRWSGLHSNDHDHPADSRVDWPAKN
ncbi:hypothetical protein [Rariglobus hedericola]|uniref:hypothetical protein n=1 Tax=Rariglobus hedericola TaxID=2597822 RepID=UPI001396B035|nr:hypothetical protein [Rariglobus hedericola]